ncbi:hypothetical protein BDN72DRAFT_897908 [Pluteus cervinus]|uniref:Uncharacterized protein n=1 Tax=Pluteus cervinus TaxID=181527 RepID=A0ACD3ASH4_9AGAR|nr:hypothetical protein BDN72DRAFT_897908 [Pluteus cervinus]
MDGSRGPNDRPTLPPIRDLFRDELSQSYSPSLTFAHPQVADDPESQPSALNTVHTNTSPQLQHLSAGQHPHLGAPRIIDTESPFRPSSHSTGVYPDPYRRPEYQPIVERSFSRDGSLLHSSAHGHEHSQNRVMTEQMYYGTGERTPTDHHSQQTLPPSGLLNSMEYSSAQPWSITTTLGTTRRSEDEEQTPVASHRQVDRSYPTLPPATQHSGLRDSQANTTTPSKYECTYCGKGFNRPSSLKIHLNSHTGEKPFVCPVGGCGRSFGVLSNMRRHARVHSQTSWKSQDLSSDEGSGRNSPSSSASLNSQEVVEGSSHRGPLSSPNIQRRHSSASASSSSSRRSRSVSSEDNGDDEGGRPEKRTRHGREEERGRDP